MNRSFSSSPVKAAFEWADRWATRFDPDRKATGRGETVLRSRQLLTSREIGLLPAVGLERISVYRKPRVAIISTGDELVQPGQPMVKGAVYDSNQAIDTVANLYGLAFLPLREEHYDFAVPESRWDSPAVQRFIALLAEPNARAELEAMGFRLPAP